MKILIVSDTHKSSGNYFEVLQNVKDMDCIVHCGDVCGDEDVFTETAPCRIEMVAGNMDYDSYLPMEKKITLGPVTALMAHGHQFGVNESILELYAEAEEQEAQIFFFGHTHKPLIRKKGDVWVINPGSIAYPRQSGGQCSYALMEIREDGEISCEICYL